MRANQRSGQFRRVRASFSIEQSEEWQLMAADLSAIGATAVDYLAGSWPGELSSANVSDQFEGLRDGDRLWYQRVFSGRALAEIEQVTLASIMQRNTTTKNLQSNVFFMQAKVTGLVYNDANRNGRQDFRENALRGVAVELLDDAGEVIATTTTDRNGRYCFDNFLETGDCQVRVVAPSGMTATKSTRDVLISRGGVTASGVNFGLRTVATTAGETVSRLRVQHTPVDRLAAVDAALEFESTTSRMDLLDDSATARSRSRIRR